MAGPINSVFAAVTEKLATITQYATAADWCHLNATHLAEAAVPPRIVWVPITEGFGPAMGQGGDGVKNPRPVATRQSFFEIHVWAAAEPQTGAVDQNAADLDACELLLNAFMWATYSKIHGAPALPFIGTGRWSRGNVDGSILSLGVAYILPMTVYIPVTRPPDTTVTVTEIPATVSLGNDSVVIDIVEP